MFFSNCTSENVFPWFIRQTFLTANGNQSIFGAY